MLVVLLVWGAVLALVVLVVAIKYIPDFYAIWLSFPSSVLSPRPFGICVNDSPRNLSEAIYL